MSANGQTTVNFGAFPGTSEASVDVAGQTGLVVTSEVEGWVLPVDTATHTADENKIERIRVIGFWFVNDTLRLVAYDNASPAWKDVNYDTKNPGAQAQRLYGEYNLGWAWN